MSSRASRTRLFSCALALLAAGCSTDSADAQSAADELRVVTWNLEWFYDEYRGDNRSDLAREKSAPSREEWNWKRDGVAETVARLRPTILAVQEVENQQVLYYLSRRLREQHDLNYRIAFIGGGDYFTEQDVGILYREGLVEFSRREQTREMFESGRYNNVTKHILGRFTWGDGAEQESLVVINVHLRAMPEATEIRQRQARLVRLWTEELMDDGHQVLVLGDFNTEERAGRIARGSDLDILMRGEGPEDARRVLADLHERIPADHRRTHLLPGRQFDRILATPGLLRDETNRRDLVLESVGVFPHGVVQGSIDEDHFDDYYGIPREERDFSDHYPVMAVFRWQ